MPKERKPTDYDQLPDTDQFWGHLTHPNIKDFCTAAIFDEIRSVLPTASHLELTASFSKLRTLVGMIDSPKQLLSIQKETKLSDAERKEMEDLI